MRLSPFNHGIYDGEQGASQLGDGIFRPGRQFGIDGLLHQSVIGQFPELHVEHSGRSFGQRTVQFAWTQGLVSQFVEDA